MFQLNKPFHVLSRPFTSFHVVFTSFHVLSRPFTSFRVLIELKEYYERINETKIIELKERYERTIDELRLQNRNLLASFEKVATHSVDRPTTTINNEQEINKMLKQCEQKLSEKDKQCEQKLSELRVQNRNLLASFEKVAIHSVDRPTTTINNSYEDEREDIDIPIPLMERMSSIIIDDVKDDVEYSNITLNNVVISSRPIDHYVNATMSSRWEIFYTFGHLKRRCTLEDLKPHS